MINELTIHKVPSGLAGVYATIRRIVFIVNDGVNNQKVLLLVRKITADIEKGDFNKEAQAIFDFVVNNVRYIRDPHKKELLINPETMISMIEQGYASGDCDDISIFMSTLLESVGIPTRFVVIKTIGRDTFSHIFPEAYLDNSWVAFDGARKNPKIGEVVPYHGKPIITPVSLTEKEMHSLSGEQTDKRKWIFYGLGAFLLYVIFKNNNKRKNSYNKRQYAY